MMGHGLYHIAYSYYKDRVLRGDTNGKPTLVGELFKKLLEGSRERQPATIGGSLRGMATRLVWSRQMNKLSEKERVLVDDFSRLFSAGETPGTAQPLLDDRRTFRIACQISHTLGYSFLRRFIEFVRKGQLMESLQTVASLAPVAMSMAPYLAAFSTQHKDGVFLQAVAGHFPSAAHLRQATQRKAWITDTYAEVNGVSRTIQALAATAVRTGHPLTVLTCLENVPPGKADLKNFPPVGSFPVPEYESQLLSFRRFWK